MTVRAETFQSSFLVSILTWPPPGLWEELASEPILDVFRRFGEGDTPTTTLFIGTEEHHGHSQVISVISLSPFFTWPGVLGEVENEVKGGREEAGTE